MPRDNLEVLETLPADGNDAPARQLSFALGRDPANLSLALQLARVNVELYRARADPRYLGHAQAALAPWWELQDPPSEVLFLRAVIRQSTHAFDAALADLDRLTVREPENAEAILTQATLLTLKGRYEAAEPRCRQLESVAPELVAAACLATVESLTGRSSTALRRLTEAEQRAVDRPVSERGWAFSILGEITTRMGDSAQGEKHYLQALKLCPGDPYTLGAYADLLLEVGRPLEVIALLKDHVQKDALLLRLAIAEARSKSAGAEAHAKILQDRFDVARRRGDTVHQREEARFELDLRKNASAALALAKENWGVQREPWDARLLMESALAAGRPADAKPVVDALTASRVEDPLLRGLLEKLGGTR